MFVKCLVDKLFNSRLDRLSHTDLNPRLDVLHSKIYDSNHFCNVLSSFVIFFFLHMNAPHSVQLVHPRQQHGAPWPCTWCHVRASINLIAVFRVIAAAAGCGGGGGDSRTGAIACWGTMVLWWFVSRFVPLFPLAIHMQSQGLYAHKPTHSHTHTHSKWNAQRPSQRTICSESHYSHFPFRRWGPAPAEIKYLSCCINPHCCPAHMHKHRNMHTTGLYTLNSLCC